MGRRGRKNQPWPRSDRIEGVLLLQLLLGQEHELHVTPSVAVDCPYLGRITLGIAVRVAAQEQNSVLEYMGNHVLLGRWKM